MRRECVPVMTAQVFEMRNKNKIENKEHVAGEWVVRGECEITSSEIDTDETVSG